MKPNHIILMIVIDAFSFSIANAQSGWYRQNVPSNGALSAVCFTDANNGTVVGVEQDSLGVVHPLLLRTTNGGDTWSRQLIPMEGGLSAVSLTDADNGTAVGWSSLSVWYGHGNPLILRTTDKGATWTSQLSDSGYTLYGVCFTDVNTGTVVGWDGVNGGGKILRTTDGGNSWTHQSSGTENCLRSVYFNDRTTGTIVGWGRTILRTSDGGTSWVPQSGGILDDGESVSFTDANTGTVVGDHIIKPGFGPVPVIVHTTDGGTTWMQASGAICALPYGISFGDAMTGTAVGGGPLGAAALVTNGAGISRSANETNSFITAIRALEMRGGQPPSLMVCGTVSTMYRDSVIFRTTDGGATWTPQSIGPTRSLSTELNAVSFSDANNGTAVGSEEDSLWNWHPLILRTTTGGVVSVAGSHEREMPKSLFLSQNYPNPFNPTTTIGYDIGGVVALSGALLSGVEGRDPTNVRLAVYDLLGREVAVLVNEKKTPGSYEVKFDGSNLASGLYFYRLQAGTFVQSKKMLLVK